MLNLFPIVGSICAISVGLRVRREELADRPQCSTPRFEKLFPRVSRPEQAGYQKRADDSEQDLLRSVEADLPCLCRIRDTIGRDRKRSETEQKVGIWNLP